MAVSKLGIYNEALSIIGERPLTTISDAVETRYALDAAWDNGAVDYCLDLIKPKFATLTAKLTSYGTDTDHGFYTFALPASYVSLVGVYQDSTLDRPSDRYFIEARKLVCPYTTAYVRYNADNTIAIPSGTDFTLLTPAFVRVLSAYLAQEMAHIFRSDAVETAKGLFAGRVKDAIASDQMVESGRRSLGRTGALSTEWLRIYNDALNILGEQRLAHGEDDSRNRTPLDTAVDSGLVASALEDIGWQFALKTVKSDYNPSISPDFGYSYAHNNPADLLIFDGVFLDEYLREPLKDYNYEGTVIYADHQELYIQYVSTDYVTSPATWTSTFKRYIAAAMAKDCVAAFQADVNRVELVWKQRKNDAKNLDASQSPPVVILPGSWVRSRFLRTSGRDRNG